MAESTQYRTIKALVLDFTRRQGGDVHYEPLTAEVLRHFPGSKWKPSHWAWYRNQMLHGRFRDLLSESERTALPRNGRSQTTIAVGPVAGAGARPELEKMERGPQARDPETKRIGDALLGHIRMVISLAAGNDVDKRFRLNRWVFARLLQDEIRVKRPIKQRLWDVGMRSCQGCGDLFKSLKGIELHRKDGAKAYSQDNCELLCRECHQELS